jgi:hypothetical protein
MAEKLRHPGPATGPRILLSQSRVERRELALRPGIPLSQAIAEALDGAASAWLELAGARGNLRFVLPDRARDGLHGAWYSATHKLPDATIHRAGVLWGQRDGKGFGHCHGLWGDTMGHLLLDDSRLTEAATAQAWVFSDACFVSGEDPETAFVLFKPQGDGPGDAALLRIAPHVELADGLAQALAALGWSAAGIRGLGSLNTASFADGQFMDSHATEFLIRQARVTPETAEIDLDIVGIGGGRASGRLATKGNRICVTAELILLKE